ncbi:MAG: hypothetical protein J6W35_03910 [Eubacterium sp.]|nr:hypothetical protein [Eubacterium sp.]
MKKKNGIIIALIVVVVVLIVVLAFVLGRNISKEEVTSAPTLAATQATQTGAPTAKVNVENSDIKVVKKYNFYDEDDFTLVLVLQNTGKADAAVAVVGKIFDGANATIETERESIFMDANSKSVVEFDFDTEGRKVKDVDYKITAAAATSIKPGLKNIMYKKSINGNIVNVTSKNEGDFDLLGVDTHVLFYQDDELVDVDSEDMIDNDSEVFVKGTEVKQRFDTKEKFDKVEIYYSQDQDKPDAEDDD